MAKIYLQNTIPPDEFFRIAQFMTRLGGNCADLAKRATGSIHKQGDLFICHNAALSELINRYKQVSK